MYLKFTTLIECVNAIKEINKRMGLNSNLTATFAIPQEDIDGNYVIPKPNNRYMDNLNFSYEIIESVEFPIAEEGV